MRDMLLEELMSMGILLTPPKMEPSQEPHEMPPEEPQERTRDGDSKCQQFLIGKHEIPYPLLFASV